MIRFDKIWQDMTRYDKIWNNSLSRDVSKSEVTQDLQRSNQAVATSRVVKTRQNLSQLVYNNSHNGIETTRICYFYFSFPFLAFFPPSDKLSVDFYENLFSKTTLCTIFTIAIVSFTAITASEALRIHIFFVSLSHLILLCPFSHHSCNGEGYIPPTPSYSFPFPLPILSFLLLFPSHQYLP